MQTISGRLRRFSRAAASILALACAAIPSAHAANASVPYVPTPQVVVDRMLEVGKVGSRDYLIDLGSGDGRIVVTAAKKYGTRGFGVDLNPTRIAEANENARKEGVTDKVYFNRQDLFEADLGNATVITMYLLPQVNLQLRPKLLDLKPGTRIVSHDFSMGDWQPEHHEQVESKDKYGGSGGVSDIFLWIVPAKVNGTWKSELQVRGKPVPYEFTLQQEFQKVSGTAKVGGRTAKLTNVKLVGDELSFDFAADVQGSPTRHHFTGKVDGAAIDGTADLSAPKLSARTDWSANR
ncbi:MAG TPA: methyltransferase domain-containing protein [Burkholderiales bacterium]|nr:methyltransferase domain-containing protein [Burkholderiales bacterium]